MILSLLLVVSLGACKKTPPPPPPLQDFAVAAPEIRRSGVVAGGFYLDGTLALVVPVPEGWIATPGQADTPLRLRLDHRETGAKVEILALPVGAREPPARPGCAWDFIDTGRYRGLVVTDEVTVATCAPDDPDDSHVFAVLLPRTELTWCLEIAPRADAMIAGKEAGEALLRGVRFERPAAIPVMPGP